MQNNVLLPLLIKTLKSSKDSTLMTSSNPNSLPKASPSNAAIYEFGD
jgi:hypothetical protein